MEGTPVTDSETVLMSRDGGLVELVLNRPTVINALNVEMADRLADLMTGLAGDASVRCVLLRGEGRGFCAGGDVASFGSDEASLARLDMLITRLHVAVDQMKRLAVPTVAVLHGAVAGAGLSLSLACDFAVAAETTKFTLAYSKIGATPDGGSTWSLPRLVGTRKALEIALLSEVFTAEDALRLGLVNRLVPPDQVLDEGRAFARRLADGPTAAYGRAKSLIYGSFAATLPEQLDREREAFLASARTQDFAEGKAAFMGKRPPSFEGR